MFSGIMNLVRKFASKVAGFVYRNRKTVIKYVALGFNTFVGNYALKTVFGSDNPISDIFNLVPKDEPTIIESTPAVPKVATVLDCIGVTDTENAVYRKGVFEETEEEYDVVIIDREYFKRLKAAYEAGNHESEGKQGEPIVDEESPLDEKSQETIAKLFESNK